MDQATAVAPVAKPLEGIKVLDFSRMLAGPYCTAMLADMGARIIKVEPPQGDDQRQIGAIKSGRSINFEMLNRNKRSLKLDLRQEKGREIAQQLAIQSDVIIENFRPGVADRLGIGYTYLSGLKPQLIYCSISGFGQSGPLSKSPSYDVVAQALSGLMSINGDPSGEATLVGESVGDILAGIYAALAINTALFQRGATGRGTHIDIAMFDALFSLLPTALAQWQLTGTSPGRSGNHHPLSAPFGAFAAADGNFMLAVANKKLFSDLCLTMKQPALADDSRFINDQLRKQHGTALQAIIEAWASSKTVEQVVALLGAAGIPASPVWDVNTAATSEQSKHRQLLKQINHPVLGSIGLPEQPIHFSGVRRGAQKPAPELGADSSIILRELLGMSAEQIEKLTAQDII